MKLKKIKVHGFKSFANPVELDISPNITAIVGPNGSGKSNILDAIKWLFGEHSLKSLRADEKYDLIFAGSDNLPPARRAYVELVFESDGNIVSVAREITRDGKGVYYINGKSARLKDIKSLFSGTGVGKDFYSIIAQGQVERIVSSSGKELRNLFEEAAGTAIFREKKKESLQKLERVENNLNTLVNVLYEKGKQMESLYLKAKRAERYLEYSERLKEIKKIYYGNLIHREEKRKKEIEERIEAARQEIREIRKKLYELESRWSTLRESMEEMDEKMKSYTKTIQTYETRKNQLLELKNHYNKKISDVENNLIQVTTKITSFEEELSRLLSRKEEISVILKSLKSEKESLEKDISLLEDEKEKITSEFSEREKRFLEVKETIRKIEKEIMRIESEISRLNDSAEDMEKRLSMIEAQKKEKSERLKDIEEELKEIQENIDATTEKEKELKEELQALRNQKEEIRREREELLKEINDLLREKGSIQIEINSLERAIENYADFNSTIRTIFKNKERFEGLYDIVANILEVDEEFQKAIESLLGGALYHIVVRDSDVAKEIIEFLKANDIGRATFLPLDMIIGHPPVLGDFSNHQGFIGMAADLVRVPKGFEKLPSYLFGNDIVVETIDDAIAVKKKYDVRGRIVSLDGDIISTRGAISGGSSKSKGGLLGRKTKLKDLKRKLKEIDINIEELERKRERVEEEILSLSKHEDIVNAELSKISAKNSSALAIRRELSKTALSLEKEISDLEKLYVEYKGKVSGMRARIERLVDELKLKNEKLHELEEETQGSSQELQKFRQKLDDIGNKLISKKMELGELSQKIQNYERELEDIKERKNLLRKNVAELEREKEILEKEIEENKKHLSQTEEELRTISKELEDILSSMDVHSEDKTSILREMEELEGLMTMLKEKRDSLNEEIHRNELTYQDVAMRIQRYKEEVVDYEDVEIVSDEELSRIKNEIEELSGKIKRIGSVDFDAIEEYKQVEKEYSDLSKQKDDLEKAKNKLNEIIRKTEEEAKKRFMEVYNKVNEVFSKYISELFFGGEGKIRMSSEDVLEADLEIVVKKPGKRIQKLQLLSGGEKALVAIALLFSFLQVNPSPFYVLDEVDGPLDDYNAERYAQFLKELSKETQFLVITHNKLVMEAADLLHGVTMSGGVSLIIPVEMLKTG